MNQELRIKPHSKISVRINFKGTKITLILALASFLILNSYFLLPRVALAHCPLCVAGAAAGITLTRWVGVDDSITGIWIGALLGAMAFWLSNLLGRKNKIFFNRFI